jgi:hypothetical protein
MLSPETRKILKQIVTSWDDYDEMHFMAVVQRLRVFHMKDLPQEAQRVLRRGGELGDLYYIWSRFWLMKTREEAAERILKGVGNVIYPNLKPYIEVEEQRQANLHHGGNRRMERQQRIASALFALLTPWRKITDKSVFDTSVKLRSNLQESVVKDLLGPKWRQARRRKPQEKGDRVLCPPYEYLMSPEELLESERGRRIRFQVEELPDLTDMCRDRELTDFQTTMAQLTDFGFTFTEIATHLSVEPNVIHQHSYKIRKKSSRDRGR